MDGQTEERGQWASKVEFVLALAGAAVGLGNVWRFPYLCYKNGGGAFLVPYLVFVATCGIPLFLLETTMGQYTQEGAITCWRKLCPLAEGIGYGSQVMMFYNCTIYIIILSWALLYLMFSFSSQLPWASCNNDWNTDNCVDFSIRKNTSEMAKLNLTTSAATEFWEQRVLAISGGIEEIGSIRWEILLCLLFMWIVCYFCVWKGVKTTGKVLYFTATFPYVMLLILLIRGLSLPGASEGLLFYLLPEISRLTDPQVWLEAGTQIFFSYSVGTGSLVVLGSYNTYNNNSYKDCLWLCLLNGCTSVVAGFAVFSVLGFMAHEQGVPITEVAEAGNASQASFALLGTMHIIKQLNYIHEGGPGLAFIVYPQAISMMPLPQLWSICFFVMLILLGLDTQFLGMEVVMASITDMFPSVMRRRGQRERFLLLFCFICFLAQLVMITEGGMFVFRLFDYYANNGVCILFICVFESLSMGWIFGADKLFGIIKDMTGMRANKFFKICWLFLTPLVSLGTFIYSLVEYQPLIFNRWYIYPTWAYIVGWILALPPILLVPGFALYKLSIGTGTLSQRFRRLCQPDPNYSPVRNQEVELHQSPEAALK